MVSDIRKLEKKIERAKKINKIKEVVRAVITVVLIGVIFYLLGDRRLNISVYVLIGAISYLLGRTGAVKLHERRIDNVH